MDTTYANAWVESYIVALLERGGLSSEHITAGQDDESSEINRSTAPRAALDEERSITARYYVNQILSLDEDRIRDAWSKASSCGSGGGKAERDARMEQLSWRVWAMKRRRASIEAAGAAEKRETLQAAAERKAGAFENQGEEDEMEDEVDATTLRTIDELNSRAMAAYDECGLGAQDVAGFGSRADQMEDSMFEEQQGELARRVNSKLQAQKLTPMLHMSQSASEKLVDMPHVDGDSSGFMSTARTSVTGERSSTNIVSSTSNILGVAAARAAASVGGHLSTPASGAAGLTSPGLENAEDLDQGAAPLPTYPLSPFASVPGTPASPFATTPRTSPDKPSALLAGLGAALQVAPGLTIATGSFTAVPASPNSGTAAGPSLSMPPTPTGATASLPFDAAAVTTPFVADPLLVSRFPRLYVVLISLHGLVRGDRMELGKDPDTGGQVKYVVEFAKSLACMPSVARVDLLTRLIADPKVHSSYGVAEEKMQLPPLPPGAAAVAAAADKAYRGNTAPVSEETTVSLQGSVPAGQGSPNAPVSARGAFIVRLPCGPSNEYLRKEDLWPHCREFADRAILHVHSTLARLQESGDGPCELYVVHGHYADAGEVAAMVASSLGVDCVLTGHSLGRNKREHLLKSGNMAMAEVEATYRISRRIEAEENALDVASVVFTSTQQEVVEQWGMYDGYSEELSAALQLRPCRGYHVPRMAVIPPGLDFSNLKVSMPADPWVEVLGSLSPEKSLSLSQAPMLTPATSFKSAGGGPQTVGEAAAAAGASPPSSPTGAASGGGGDTQGATPRVSQLGGTENKGGEGLPSSGGSVKVGNRIVMTPDVVAALMGGEEPRIWKEINRFLRHPGKPVILAMSRPDTKKNILGLVRAFGGSRLLRDLANLVLIMGNRDKIDGMPSGSARVLSDVLKLVDTYDLYGSVAYPKKHSQAEISDIYLLAAATRGVFVNPALQEPFGLTLIEAAAHGVPIVATTYGGPVDIISTLHNGLLVEPTDPHAVAEAIIKIVTSQRKWEELSENGRSNITAYSWPSHCARYLRTVEDQKSTQQGAGRNNKSALVYQIACPAASGGKQGVLKGAATGVGDMGTWQLGAGMSRPTLSLSYNDLGSLARAIAASTSSAAAITNSVLTAAAAAGLGSQINSNACNSSVNRAASCCLPTQRGAQSEVARGVGARPAADAQPAAIEGIEATDTRSQMMVGRAGQELGKPDASAGLKAGAAGEAPCPRPEKAPVSPFFGGSLEMEGRSTSISPNSKLFIKGGSRTGRWPSGGLHIPVTALDVDTTPGSQASAHLATFAFTTSPDTARLTSTPPGKPQTGMGADGPSRSGSMHATAESLSMMRSNSAPRSRDQHAIGFLDSGSDAAWAPVHGQTDLLPHKQPVQLKQHMSALEEVEDEEQEADRALPMSPTRAHSAGSPKEASIAQRHLSSTGHSGQTMLLQPRIVTHEGFVVFCLDSVADVPRVAPLIKVLLAGQQQSKVPSAELANGEVPLDRLLSVLSMPVQTVPPLAGAVGVGVACMWSHKEARTILAREGVDPLDLDFIVTNAGGLVWHTMLPADAATPPTSGDGTSRSEAVEPALPTFMCDEEWEHHTDFRWDERLVQQVLARILASRTGWGRLHLVWQPRTATVKGAASGFSPTGIQTAGSTGVAGAPSGATVVGVQISPKSSPMHYMVMAEVIGAAGGRAPQPISELALLLLAAVRRKLRMSGVRAQLTASLVTEVLGSDDGSMTDGTTLPTAGQATQEVALPRVCLHITPLRCSRALALRYLAIRFHRPLGGCGRGSAVSVGSTAAAIPGPKGSSNGKATGPPSGLVSELSASPGDVARGTVGFQAGSEGKQALGIGTPARGGWTLVLCAAPPGVDLPTHTASGAVVTPSGGSTHGAGDLGRASSGASSGNLAGGVGAAPLCPVVALHSSDGEQLVGGVQRVVLLTSAPSSADTRAPPVQGDTRAVVSSKNVGTPLFPVDTSVYRAAVVSLDQPPAQPAERVSLVMVP